MISGKGEGGVDLVVVLVVVLFVRLIHRNPRTPTAHRFAAGNPGAVPLFKRGR